MPNALIENNVIIGAGSVVTKDIPDNSVAVGSPVRVICFCDEYTNKHENKMSNENNVYWNVSRVDLNKKDLVGFNKNIDNKVVYFMGDTKK